MAIVDDNGIHGRLGHVYFRMRNGKKIMCNMPSKRNNKKRRKNNKPGQQAGIDSFTEGSMFANRVMKIPEMAIALKAAARGTKYRSGWHLAQAVGMTSPDIIYIDAKKYDGAIGSLLVIKAKDVFKVERMQVQIIDANNKALEKGEAVRYLRKPLLWKYFTAVANTTLKGTTIRATGFNMMNKGMLEIVL